MNFEQPQVNDAENDGKLRMQEIKDFEEKNGVNQDVIAQSYLAHVDIYKQLQEKSEKARDNYYLLEKTNGANHPSVVEAKKDWDDLNAEKEKENNIMLPMLNHLTGETLEKYKNDFELHGAINQN